MLRAICLYLYHTQLHIHDRLMFAKNVATFDTSNIGWLDETCNSEVDLAVSRTSTFYGVGFLTRISISKIAVRRLQGVRKITNFFQSKFK